MRVYFPRFSFAGRLALRQSGIAESATVALATLAALALLASVLAYWTWVWLAPRPEPGVQYGQDVPRAMASARALFGVARLDANAPAATGISMKLLGVAAARTRGGGYAVVQLESQKVIAVREGDEIAPGVRVAEVHGNGIVLSRNGARETLEWPKSGAAVGRK